MDCFEDYCKVIFWDFKRMDNVVYNFDIITTLIDDASNSKNPHHHYKPLIILMMGIIECTLFDFLTRTKEIRYEKINLTEDEKALIRNKEIPDKLKSYIDICKKHAFLGVKEGGYKTLYKYADIRNRVHIQNIKKTSPIRDWNLWNDVTKVKTCGNLFKSIFKYLCLNYPRGNQNMSEPDFKNFPTPWEKL